MDDYANLKQPTRFLVDDLAGGTALATYQDSLAFECDVGTITRLPAADIIWVLDDQVDHWQIKPRLGSTLITNFFARALASGLDFRMGVANMGPPGDASCLGKFCSAPSSDPADKGGKDWFLLPGQQSSFHGCLANPPCLMGKTPHGLTAARAAVKRHLPRASNDPARIRNNALLVIILVSDDAPHELSQVLAAGDVKKCTLDAGTENKVELLLRPELNYYTGVTNPEAAAQVHLLGGLCGGSCGARVGHGYLHLSRRLAGLQFDICQPDLGPSLEILVEEIVGKASPIVLDYVPVASTLRVAMDAVRVFRSRTNGFEYRGGGNSLVFINTKYKKGSEVVTGYKRWRRQEKL